MENEIREPVQTEFLTPSKDTFVESGVVIVNESVCVYD